jgi:hypothetical protein
MGLDNLSNLPSDVQNDCAIIKNILLSMCEGKITFLANKYPVTMEYKNRELLILENNVVISSLPFEIIYFDLKKDHLDSSKYEEAILNLLDEEINKATLQKYA